MMPFLSLVALLFASCGTEAKYPLKVELLAEPVVIDTEFNYAYVDETGTQTSKTVSPHWFKAAFKFTNEGTETITVVSLRLTVTIPSDSSASSASSSSSSTTNTATCDFSPSTAISTASDYHLFVLGPGEKTSNIGAFNSGDFQGVGGFCSGLGFPEDGVTFKTNVDVKVNGWIGPSTGATARLIVDEQSFDTQ